MATTTARISSIACPTEAEGPGKRWAIWFQGCSIRCPGCCNPHLFQKDGGELRTIGSLLSELDHARASYGIEGITLLGGEPTEQLEASTQLAAHAQKIGLTVLVFTGKSLAQLKECKDAAMFLDNVDLLVDGPFDRSQPENSRRWIGSANQGLHVLSNRTPWPDPRWELPNTLEIKVRQGKVLVNGFPLHDRRFPIGIKEYSHGNQNR